MWRTADKRPSATDGTSFARRAAWGTNMGVYVGLIGPVRVGAWKCWEGLGRAAQDN